MSSDEQSGSKGQRQNGVLKRMMRWLFMFCQDECSFRHDTSYKYLFCDQLMRQMNEHSHA